MNKSSGFNSRLSVFVLLLLLGLLSCFKVLAHPPGLSSTEIKFDQNTIRIKHTFSTQDIEALVPMDSDGDAEVSPAELDNAKRSIAELIGNAAVLQADDRTLDVQDAATVLFDDQNNTHVEVVYGSAIPKALSFDIPLIKRFAEGHKHFVNLKNAQNSVLGEAMLTQQDSRFVYPSDKQTTPVDMQETPGNSQQELAHASTFIDFLKLGTEHILIGYDHLLFLFSLLVVTHQFWPAFKIITFFTLAHSITLALASLNVVELSSSIVEPLIAVTIIYVALENFWRKGQVKGRGYLTFSFGLIHGFGFASVLRELGIADQGKDILLPLLSFNLGVEIGQILVASILLPLIWWLHKQPLIENKLIPLSSLLATLMGSYWLLERTLLS